MAIIHEVDEAALAEWLKDRPQVIQDMAAQCPPGRLYRLASSGHRVFVRSYSENRTMTVIVSGKYNLVAFERQVFGISPDDLTECELPAPDEPVGSADVPIEVVKAMMQKKAEEN